MEELCPPRGAPLLSLPQKGVTLGARADPEWLEMQIPSHFADYQLLVLTLLVLISPLFPWEFYCRSKMAVSKKKIPGGPHEILARLGAVTQNGRQHHLDPKATSSSCFLPLLIQTDSKGVESLAAQNTAKTSVSSSAVWKLAIRLGGN